MIRTNLEHPFRQESKISTHGSIQSQTVTRIIPGSPTMLQPPAATTHVNGGQPRITFSSRSVNPSTVQPMKVSEPVFREMREKYARPPPTTVIEVERQKVEPARKIEQNETRAVRVDSHHKKQVVSETPGQQTGKGEASDQQKMKRQPLKQQQLKYDKLKTTFDSSSSSAVYVDKKLNVTEVAQKKEGKVQTSNQRIQCILEEKQALEDSMALFSQVSYLKKKANDYEQSNDRLRAEVYSLKGKLATAEEEKVTIKEDKCVETEPEEDKKMDQSVIIEQQVRDLLSQLKNKQETESQLEKQLKMVQIQLRKARNESSMAKINQSEISKKCHILMGRNRSQEQQIERLRALLSQRETQKVETPLENASPKSETGSQSVTYILN